MSSEISLVIMAVLAVAAIAIAVLAWRVARQGRLWREELDRASTELAAASREREVSFEQIAVMQTHAAAISGVLDALPIPVWRRRMSDLRLMDGNRAYAMAVDATRDNALGEQRELAAGVLGGDGRALATRARSTAAPQRESRHIVIAGSRRFLEINEVPLPGSGEIIGFARDFTDLETYQAELTRHTDAHGEVLENVVVAIAIYAPDTRLNFFNRAFASLWHLDAEWLRTGPNIDEVLERLREQRRLPEHVDFRAYKRSVQDLFTSLIAPRQELMHLPDERTLRLAIAPHPFGGLIFVYEDVTDRLALERSFNTLIEVQRETLDNLKEAVAVFGTDGRLKLWNPAFASIWNIAADHLSGEPHISDLVEAMRPLIDRGEEWPAQRKKLVARLMSNAAASERIERKDGSILQFASVTLPDGNTLLLYIDITDTTRLASALSERNDALEAADRLKSEFIANISYELRTPLNVILGFSELLAAQYFGPLNARQMEYSTGILDSAKSLTALINDILDLASIEAGYFELERESVDLHALMSSLHLLWHEQALKRELTLRLDCAPNIGSMRLDQRRMKQALFALLSNAFKFTPSGGEIVLAAKRSENGVLISVSDTGRGVASEDHVRIFDKFERGALPAGVGGAGLGLTLVKSIVELHGGKVVLDSLPGTGTAVTLRIPDSGAAG